ncbi:MAG: DUF393 domain-containing protein [Bacteroidota bacterium]|nr:DUF393 domain-containing protein [Bacteroidota bacterium]
MRYLLYDGDCSFCSSIVHKVSSVKGDSLIIFVPFKSIQAKELIALHSINDINSVIYINSESKIYFKASAVLNICKILKFPYYFLYSFNILPNYFLNLLYDFVARNRTRL